MQFLVIGKDGTDSAAPSRRAAVRPAHIELGNQLREEKKHLFGVALLNNDGGLIGSVLLVDFENREALDRWLEIEPYVTGNVWKTIEINPCTIGPSFINCLR